MQHCGECGRPIEDVDVICCAQCGEPLCDGCQCWEDEAVLCPGCRDWTRSVEEIESEEKGEEDDEES